MLAVGRRALREAAAAAAEGEQAEEGAAAGVAGLSREQAEAGLEFVGLLLFKNPIKPDSPVRTEHLSEPNTCPDRTLVRIEYLS